LTFISYSLESKNLLLNSGKESEFTTKDAFNSCAKKQKIKSVILNLIKQKISEISQVTTQTLDIHSLFSILPFQLFILKPFYFSKKPEETSVDWVK